MAAACDAATSWRSARRRRSSRRSTNTAASKGCRSCPRCSRTSGAATRSTARVERACDTINLKQPGPHGCRTRSSSTTSAATALVTAAATQGAASTGRRHGCARPAIARRPRSIPTPRRSSKRSCGRARTQSEEGETIYRCQATEFVRATDELGWWDAQSFGREVSCGNVSVWRWFVVCTRIVVEEIRRRLGLWSYPVSRRDRGAERHEARPPGR